MARLQLPLLVRAAFALWVLAAAVPAIADYPDRPIRLVVPFPAGGAADMIARVIALPLSQALGQPILIDPKPGADNLIAGEAVAKAAPDGYTLLFGGSTGISYAPIARRRIPYDPVTGFSPIGHICADSAYFLFVHGTLPVRSVDDLLDLARSQPGRLSYGSVNAFSALAGIQFGQGANAKMLHVPYNGEASMLPDLLAGRIQLAIATGRVMAHVKDGRLRVLATTMHERSHLRADVPTFSEAGLQSVGVISWSGLFGPPGMQSEVVERLTRELRQVLIRSDVREVLEQQGCQPRASSSTELSAVVKEQLVTWRRAMDAAGIRPQ